jgi:hypothetical protein
MKYIKYFLLPILGFAIFFLIYEFFIPHTAYKINLDQTAVVKQIQSLNRLETAQFSIEKIIDAKNQTNNIFQQFLYGDKILLIAHGEVIAGFDLAQLNKQAVVVQNNELLIRLPAPKILVSKLDSEKTRVYDRTKGILTPLNSDLEYQARIAAEKSIVDAACQSNILNVASANAKKQIESIFSSYGFAKISVIVEQGACTL